MKKKAPLAANKEEWKVDNLWFVHSPDNFFHLSEVKYIIRKAETNIIIGMIGNGIEVNFKITKDRDRMFKWFQSVLINYTQVQEKHHAEHHKILQAFLANQQKLLKQHE